MPSICLSVVSNIRCTDLVRWQQVVLLILSSVDIAVVLKFLNVNWHHMRQYVHRTPKRACLTCTLRFQWALILEVIVYFGLSLFDFLLEEHDGQGIALYLFDAYDEAIGTPHPSNPVKPADKLVVQVS